MDEHAASLVRLIHGKTRHIYGELAELRRLTGELVHQFETLEGDTKHGQPANGAAQSRPKAEAGIPR